MFTPNRALFCFGETRKSAAVGCGSEDEAQQTKQQQQQQPRSSSMSSTSPENPTVKLRHSFSLGLADVVRAKASAASPETRKRFSFMRRTASPSPRGKESLSSSRSSLNSTGSPHSTPTTPTSKFPSFRLFPVVGEEADSQPKFEYPADSSQPSDDNRKHYGQIFVEDIAARCRESKGLKRGFAMFSLRFFR